MTPKGTPDDNETTLVRVTLVLCTLCLSGAGGECHVPGCALWMSSAPDIPLADKCELFQPLESV